ncbi:MAG: SDR family oxidoreductase [Myxococcota bacterium]
MAAVLIAGCGYVGNALARLLIAEGDEVYGLRRTPSQLAEGVHPIVADLSDRSTIRELPTLIDSVVYVAAPGVRSQVGGDRADPVRDGSNRHERFGDGSVEEAYEHCYVRGLSNLLAELNARGAPVRRLIFVSSASVYGQQNGEWVDENSPTEPRHFRGKIMLRAEQTAQAGPFPATVIRLAGIYGPGRTNLLRKVAKGEARVPLHPRYTNRIHRDDCAGAIAHVLGLYEPSSMYLGVDHEPATSSEVVHHLARELGVDEPLLDEDASQGESRSRNHKRCSNARLVASGYQFQHASFREGYRDLVQAHWRLS